MDALRDPWTDTGSAAALSLQLDGLEVEIYRTLSIGAAVAEVSAAARDAGLADVRIRADLLASDAASRGGDAAHQLDVQRWLLDEAQAAGYAALVRRASTYLASTCDRLGMREQSMGYAYAGLSEHDTAWGDEPVVWRAEALMILVMMTLSRPGADVALIDRAADIMRRDGRPTMVAATEANFAEMARNIGRPDIAVRLAADATATIGRHPEAEAVLTWESIAVGRIAGGDLAGAATALQRALQIEPILGVSDSNGDPWLTFAEVCLQNNQPHDGLQALSAQRRPAPTSTWVSSRELRVRSQLHAALGEWRAAYEFLERHLEVYQQIRSIEGDRAVIDVESRVGVEEERQRSREFQHQAMTDPLTGLANRRAVEQWLDDAAEHEAPSLTIAIIDVDHFKDINDRFSHEVGDRVLERLSGYLTEAAEQQLGGPSLVGRLGGEEFIVAWSTPSAAAGVESADLIRARIADASMLDLAPGLSLTVSIGTAYVEDPTELAGSPRAALQRADAALYRAKDAGRNAVRPG